MFVCELLCNYTLARSIIVYVARASYPIVLRTHVYIKCIVCIFPVAVCHFHG